MKIKSFWVFFLLVIVSITFSAKAEKIKVACVGNSITGGNSNYPSSLPVLLGEEYDVRNFGNGGKCVAIKNEGAYILTNEFKNAKTFEPDIVIIKLGTNDATDLNWDEGNGKLGNGKYFKEDMLFLIGEFEKLNSRPEIILCYPVPLFSGGIMGAYKDTLLTKHIHPIIKEISEEKRFKLVDLYTPFSGKGDLFPDGIHPNIEGAYIIAKEIYAAITGKPFYINPEGIILLAGQIKGQNAGLTVEGEYVKGMSNGSVIDLGMNHFGSLGTYAKIEIGVKGVTSAGTVDFYLDEETTPFASVGIAGNPDGGFLLATNTFSQKIFDKHTVSAKWNVDNALLKSISIKNEFTPFIPQKGHKYFIVNKATGKVLDGGGSSVMLAAPDGRETQLFSFEQFSVDMYRIKMPSQADSYIRNEGSKLTIGDPNYFFGGAAPDYSLFIKSPEEGYYTISKSDSHVLGITGSSVVGNKSINNITDTEKWSVIDANIPFVKRVACVGDDNTGNFSKTEDYNKYPVSLSGLISENEYEVKQFGEKGTTITSSNNTAFKSTSNYTASLAYNPDIVIINFGTNDALKNNWQFSGKDFEADYLELIRSYEELPSNPQVILALPTPLFTAASSNYSKEILQDEIVSLIRQIAEEKGLALIDFNTLFENKQEYFPNGIHPNGQGAFLMAQKAYENICSSPFVIHRKEGIRIYASEIDTEGTPAFLENEYLANTFDGLKLSFPVNFGSKDLMRHAGVEMMQGSIATGTFDLYLDDDFFPFASIGIGNSNRSTFSVQGADIYKKIRGIHTVHIVWNGHDAKLKSVSFGRTDDAFVPDAGKQYYFVNKTGNLVIDKNAVSNALVLSELQKDKPTQLFEFDRFSIDTYRLRNTSGDMYLQNKGITIALAKEGAKAGREDYTLSVVIEPTGDGYYTLKGSEGIIGRESLLSTTLRGNRTEITDLEKWSVVESGLITSVSPTHQSGVTIYGNKGEICIVNAAINDIVSVYDLSGKAVKTIVMNDIHVRIPVAPGFYIVKVGTATSGVTAKVVAY